MSKSSLIVLSKPDVFWTGHNASRPKCTHEHVPAKQQKSPTPYCARGFFGSITSLEQLHRSLISQVPRCGWPATTIPYPKAYLDMMSAHLHSTPRAFQITRCSKPFRRKTRRKAGHKKRENNCFLA
jgi:hypothetical protein